MIGFGSFNTISASTLVKVHPCTNPHHDIPQRRVRALSPLQGQVRWRQIAFPSRGRLPHCPARLPQMHQRHPRTALQPICNCRKVAGMNQDESVYRHTSGQQTDDTRIQPLNQINSPEVASGIPTRKNVRESTQEAVFRKRRKDHRSLSNLHWLPFV